MGLDMYLERYPRYKNFGPRKIHNFEEWLEWKDSPNKRIYEQVAYWRKANAVHKWFVDNIQDGVDDCEYHSEVRKDQLEDLVLICEKILESVVLVKGKIQNGWNFKKGKEVPNYEEGLTIVNPEVCAKLLPTQDGFFFGGTDYDQYYMYDVQETYEMCKKVLEETDFEKQMLFYCSSW